MRKLYLALLSPAISDLTIGVHAAQAWAQHGC